MYLVDYAIKDYHQQRICEAEHQRLVKLVRGSKPSLWERIRAPFYTKPVVTQPLPRQPMPCKDVVALTR